MSVDAASLLSAKDVTVRFGGVAAVDRVSVTLHRGEIVALVGPNGAGKTTLLRALAGIEAAEGGIALGGTALAATPMAERARRIAYLPQGHTFYWPMPAAAIVALGRLPHADPFTGLSAADRDAVAQAMQATGVTALADRVVTTLSGGERARVALARALATQAPVLLADEPTVSLDPRHQLVVMDLLRRAAQNGAVLTVLHDLTLAARFCDRVLVMESGRLVSEGTAEEALSPQQIAAVFGVDAVTVDIGEGRVPIARHPL